MYKHSDTGAYWFGMLVIWAINLPIRLLLPGKKVTDYYDHAWQGHSGHSVWVDQGDGKAKYDNREIIERIKNEFGFDVPEISGK